MKPWPGLRSRGADGRGGGARRCIHIPAGGLRVVGSVLHSRVCGLVDPVAVRLVIGKLPGKAHPVSATAGKGLPRHNRNALIIEVVAKSVAGAPVRFPAIHKNNYALRCEPSIHKNARQFGTNPDGGEVSLSSIPAVVRLVKFLWPLLAGNLLEPLCLLCVAGAARVSGPPAFPPGRRPA